VLLIVFGFAANFAVNTLKVAAVGPGASAFAATVANNPEAAGKLDLYLIDDQGTAAQARTELVNDHADFAVVLGEGAKPQVLIDGSNLFAAQAARILVAQLGGAVDVQVLFNPDLKTSWVMVPAIIGLILTFVGTIVTSIGLVKERESGTLEQLAVMPLPAPAVILGKIAPYFLLAGLDMAIVTLLGMWIFGVPFNGSVLAFIVGAALFLFVVLGIGVLISTVSQTTGQAVQVAFMTMLPQILLSGMIFPLDAMAAGVRWIGYILPLTWFTKVSQGVMIRGASWDYLWLPLLILATLAVVIFGAAVARLSRDIRPARGAPGARAHRGAPSAPGARPAGEAA
jgi:ABC-2 type transport system permease protein